MRRTRSRWLIAILLVLLLILAACGDGEDAPELEAEDDEPLALDLDEAPEAEEPEEEPAEEEAPAAEFGLTAAVVDYTESIPDGWMFIRSVEDLEAAIEVADPVLIDVRTAEEVKEAGTIPGSINIDLRELAQNLQYIPTDRPVYVYCATAWRGGIATSALRMLGYDNVTGFAPGAPGWDAAGNELAPEAAPLEDFGMPDVEPELVAALDDFLTTLPEGYLTFPGAENAQRAQEAGAVLLDIRQPEDFAEGHVADAITIPIRELATSDEIPTDTEVIVYCGSGWRTALSMPILHLLGYDNVRGFPGGFDAWAEAGAEVV